MEEIAGLLCGLSFVLAVVTVLGHGLWLLAAALLRLVSGAEKRTPSNYRACPSCGAILATGAQRCHDCGRAVESVTRQTPADDVAATIRQLTLLYRRGVLDAAELDRLIGLLQVGETRRSEQVARPAATPVQETAATSTSPFQEVARPSIAPSTAAPGSSPEEKPKAGVIQAELVQPVEPARAAAGAATEPSRTPPVREPREAVHALERDYAAASERPSLPRRTIADLLKSFMAERNIRWGELVSGVLIVGSAVGLVISLRATLSEAIPYFPALIFMLITLGIHGAGIYTLRRWNLRATSRGVLTIALLLTPLNFLAAIIMSGSQERPVTDPLYLLAVIVGLAVVGWITYSAGRALLLGGWWRLTVAVTATSLGQLIIDRQAGPDPSLWRTSLLAALPIAGFVAATVSQLRRAIQWRRISQARATDLLLVLGVSTFALLPPLGLLVAADDSVRMGFARIAPVFSLAAAVVLATGLLFHRRVLARQLAALRTAGTALAVTGAMFMVAAVALAWPEPDLLIAVGLTNFAILLAVAVIGRLPVLHPIAAACLALAVLVGFHAAQGNLVDDGSNPSLQLLRAFGAARSAIVLSILAALVTGVAGVLQRARWPVDALYCLLSVVGLSVLSIAIAAFAGFGPGADTELATGVFAFYAVAAIAAAVAVNRAPHPAAVTAGQIAAWTGSALLLVALLHGLWLNPLLGRWLATAGVVLPRPVVTAFLLHANLCAVLAIVFARRRLLDPVIDRSQPLWSGLVYPLTGSALATAVVVLPTSLWIEEAALGHHAVYLFAGAVVWLLAAILFRRAEAVAVFQTLAAAGMALLVAWYCREAGWGQRWWLDPRHIQLQLIVLAAWCVLWAVRRRISLRWKALADLIHPSWPAADEILVGISLLGLVALAISACWPGVLYELGVTPTLSVAESHALAYGAGTWLALGVIAVALMAPAAARWQAARLVGLSIAGAVIPLLIAAHWEGVCATASALRWTCALYALVTAILVWLRGPLDDFVSRLRWLGLGGAQQSGVVRETALLLGGVPVVVITSAVVWRNVAGWPLGAPATDTVFAQMGLTISFAVPLLVLVGVLVGHALRERCSSYALAGSVLLQYVICLAFMLQVAGTEPEFLAGLLQWNAVGLGAYAILWSWLAPRMQAMGQVQLDAGANVDEPLPSSADSASAGASNTSSASAARTVDRDTGKANGGLRNTLDVPLLVQLTTMGIALSVLSVWAALAVFLTPDGFSGHTLPLGEPPSYLAWVLAAVAATWSIVRHADSRTLRLIQAAAGLALAFVALAAISVEPLDTTRHWLGYHVLTCGWLAVAAGLTVATFRWALCGRAAVTVCVLVTILACRGSVSDPSLWAPWWSVGAAAGVFVLAAVLSLRYRSQWLAYGSMVPLILATSFYWIGGFTGRWPVDPPQAVADFVQANLIALAAGALLWLLVDLWYQRREQPAGFDAGFSLVPVHVTAAFVGLIISAVCVVGSFGINCLAREAQSRALFEVTGAAGVLVVASLGLLLIGALWEVRRSYALPCLYVWGLVVMAFCLDAWQLPIRTAFFAVGVAIAGYVTLTGLIWRQGAWLASLASNCGIREPISGLRRTAGWLPVVNLVFAAAATLMTLAIVLSFPERWMRITSAMAPALLAVGLAALAQKERRTLLEYTSLLMTGIAAVCLSWADLEPQWNERMVLLRTTRLLIVLAALTFVYGVLVARLPRLAASWLGAVRRIAVTFGIAALGALTAVLLLETLFFRAGIGAPVDTPQMLVVVVVLVGLAAGFISLALLPGRGPFTLSERGRMGFVYAAELIAALIFAHVYLCRPWIFAGYLRAYWPFIVMAIAFAGVGVGELFRRSGMKVLSDPLQRTGTFLPLLPALGVWVVAAEKTDYAALMFTVGLLYLALSGLRRSVTSGLAAALAGNVALWSLWVDADLSLWRHPQLWLIPPALSALIAGQINHRRLTSSQMAGLRYASILMIYLSSTSEIFLQGVGQALWPPMVLAGLSVAGFFLGIMLHVRSFLYLGASFVLFSVLSMVWHAHVAIQHSWPLWAFGIGLGIGILVLFALFEKQRPQITGWVERIQRWEN